MKCHTPGPKRGSTAGVGADGAQAMVEPGERIRPPDGHLEWAYPLVVAPKA